MKIEKIGVGRPKSPKPKSSSHGRTKTNSRKVYDSSRWRNSVRPAQLQKQPFCEKCLELDELVDATEVDHKKPISMGGDIYALSNLQSLCSSCHAKKSAYEGYLKKKDLCQTREDHEKQRS